MPAQELAAHITEIILGLSSAFLFIFKYRELLGFGWKVINWLLTPVKIVIRWIKLARKLEIEIAENKKDINLGRKEIDDVRVSIEALSKFVKEKLSPNGGSSPIDAINRIEGRQILNEARHNALLDNSENGIFFCDPSGKNTWVNRTYSRILGCGASELLDFGWKKFICTSELDRYSKVWKAAFEDGSEFEDIVEFSDIHHAKIKLNIIVTAIKNEKNIVTSYVGQVSLVN